MALVIDRNYVVKSLITSVFSKLQHDAKGIEIVTTKFAELKNLCRSQLTGLMKLQEKVHKVNYQGLLEKYDKTVAATLTFTEASPNKNVVILTSCELSYRLAIHQSQNIQLQLTQLALSQTFASLLSMTDHLLTLADNIQKIKNAVETTLKDAVNSLEQGPKKDEVTAIFEQMKVRIAQTEKEFAALNVPKLQQFVGSQMVKLMVKNVAHLEIFAQKYMGSQEMLEKVGCLQEHFKSILKQLEQLLESATAKQKEILQSITRTAALRKQYISSDESFPIEGLELIETISSFGDKKILNQWDSLIRKLSAKIVQVKGVLPL